MSELKKIHEEMARIATNARAKLDEIADDTPDDRVAEIEAEFDRMMADHDKLAGRAERLRKLADAEDRAASAPDPRRPGGAARGEGTDEGAAITYRDAFHAYIRSQGNVGVLSVEERAALASGYAAVEHRAQTTSATAGGYTVPEELAAMLIKSMAAWGPMYDPGVTSEIVTSGGYQIDIPTVNDTTTPIVKHTEGTTLTDDGGSDVTFGQKVLNAYPFNTEWIRVSKELVDDSIFNIEALLGELLGERLGRRANTELTTGDGSGDPNGIVTASAAGKTAASATAITWDELIDLEHAIDPAYRASPRCAYMFNDLTLSALRKLKNGDGVYLWQQGNVREGVPSTINGRRYYVNQAMANIATTAKPVIFGDLGKYYVRKVGSPLIGAIQDKDFWPGFGIAGYIRFDGELLDTAAVKHLVMA